MRRNKPDELRTVDGYYNRVNIGFPEEVWNRLLELASDLDFSHLGKVAVTPLIDAISQLEPEQLESVLGDAGLLPYQNREPERDAAWRLS